MPKPVKKGTRKGTTKRPSSDPITRARQQMEQHLAMAEIGVKPWTATEPAPDVPADFDAAYRAHMAKLGAKGGKVSGAKRMEMPEAKRKAIAKKAAAARWAKKARS